MVLGKAKVMSYEDLEEARAKRAAKEQNAAGKGKSRRKRKKQASEADALEPKAKAACMSEAPESARASRTLMSEAQVAPVARMI